MTGRVTMGRDEGIFERESAFGAVAIMISE
jgi:hypothetical protein